jgi:DNA processing protein
VKLIEERGGKDADRIEASKDDRDAVAALFYRGDIAVASMARSVAIVGTRHPTDWGRRAARAIADRFAEQGWAIVSGLALGVDTVAHESAVKHKAATVAILGNGLASVYPASNRHLADRILGAGGLLLAEVPPHARVEPRVLVKRDRLQSGLAALTVVCQGGRTSGAMHTARFAAEQGRPLYVPALARGGNPVGEQDEGTQALLSDPAACLPDLLPAWRSASKRATAGAAPVALPLDESVLAQLGSLEPRNESESEPPMLI